MPLYLASGSPRRRDLLQAAGLTFVLCATDAEEVWPEGMGAAGAVAVAEQKLRASWTAWPAQAADPKALWLAADTAVLLAGEVLGKPQNAAHAHATLRKLAGRTHEVVTGFVIGQAGRVLYSEAAITQVQMRPLADVEIGRYVATGEPMDKAGAYAVQGLGQALVARMTGSLTNVVGLPLAEVLAALAEAGNTQAMAITGHG